jgi:hypothetical protein
MSKNVAETEGAQMTSQYGAYALRAGLARLYAHAHTRPRVWVTTCTHARTHAHACTQGPICNTYCFSTATIISWTRLNVTLCVHCLSCWFYIRSFVRGERGGFYNYRLASACPPVLCHARVNFPSIKEQFCFCLNVSLCASGFYVVFYSVAIALCLG